MQVSTGFIAGVTVVFGIVALDLANALTRPEFGEGVAKLAGAFGFSNGLVFVVVGARMFTVTAAAVVVLLLLSRTPSLSTTSISHHLTLRSCPTGPSGSRIRRCR